MWTRIKYDPANKKWVVKDYPVDKLQDALFDLMEEDEDERIQKSPAADGNDTGKDE